MIALLTFAIFGCLIGVHSLDEPSQCGEEYNIWKKFVDLEQEIEILKNKQKEEDANVKCKNVAFRAQLTKKLGEVTSGQKIVYDGVELNNGKAYHPYHGVFTAPCDGIYMFSITIGNDNKKGVLHLKKNDVTIEYIWAGYNQNWDMGGVSTVVKLVAGDDVWVEGRGSIDGTNAVDAIGMMKYVAFTGALINAI